MKLIILGNCGWKAVVAFRLILQITGNRGLYHFAGSKTGILLWPHVHQRLPRQTDANICSIFWMSAQRCHQVKMASMMDWRVDFGLIIVWRVDRFHLGWQIDKFSRRYEYGSMRLFLCVCVGCMIIYRPEAAGRRHDTCFGAPRASSLGATEHSASENTTHTCFNGRTVQEILLMHQPTASVPADRFSPVNPVHYGNQ